jgi:hypothetical protein
VSKTKYVPIPTEELLAAADRVLPEYADKLDRLVQTVLTLSDRRDHPVDDPRLAADRERLLSAAIRRLGKEFWALANPLREWINRLSATLEERDISEVQRMELRLRLTELEMKYQTASETFSQLGVS